MELYHNPTPSFTQWVTEHGLLHEPFVVVDIGVQGGAPHFMIQGGIGLGLSIDVGIAEGSASITLAVQITVNGSTITLLIILNGQASVDVLGGVASASLSLTAAVGVSVNPLPVPQINVNPPAITFPSEDITFIARGQHLKAIQAHGLCVETPTGEIVIQPAKATDDPTQVAPVDVIFVGVKAWQVETAARDMRPIVGPETFVVPLQNGVEAPSQLAAVLGAKHVLGGLCGTFSWVAAPGRIRNIGTSSFIKFGELDNRRSERAERLRQSFEKAGVKIDIPADIHKAGKNF